jgi:DNA-directed RNA polymerase alpha subunit
MRILKVAAVASLVFGLAACNDDSTPPPAGGAAPSAADGVKRAAEGVAAAAEKAKEDLAKKAGEVAATAREEASKAANATLDALKTKIDELKAQAAAMDPLKKATAQTATNALDSQWADAKKLASSLATSENFEEIRSKLDKTLEALKAGLENAAKLAGG